MSIYAKILKAYKNYRLLNGLKKKLSKHNGPLLLHDTHFSRAIPKQPKFLIYDCVDLPLMHQRTSKACREKHEYLKAILDCNAKRAVSKSELILLTSPFYEKFISSWVKEGIRSVLLRNFTLRDKESLEPNVEMKKTLRRETGVSHWIVIHNRIGEFIDIDGALMALDKLQRNWGICFLGVFDENCTISEIEGRAQKYCPNHKVLCHDALYGDEKLSALKCFDLGLVPLVSESQNLKRCIPNRALEFLGVGLPQIVSRTKALKDFSADFPENIFAPKKVGQEHFEALLKTVCNKIETSKTSMSMKKAPDWSQDFRFFQKVINKEVKDRGLSKDVIILSENNPKKITGFLTYKIA